MIIFLTVIRVHDKGDNEELILILWDTATSPSLALSISYANGGFYHTGFYSYQDTVTSSDSLILSLPWPILTTVRSM